MYIFFIQAESLKNMLYMVEFLFQNWIWAIGCYEVFSIYIYF